MQLLLFSVFVRTGLTCLRIQLHESPLEGGLYKHYIDKWTLII